MLHALFFAVSVLGSAQGIKGGLPGAWASKDAHVMSTQPSIGAYATFVPICRDRRGTWDRRACRHLRRSDPSRLILA